MKIANSRAALRHFDKGRLGHPELPANPGTVHALFYVNPDGPLTPPWAWRYRGWNWTAAAQLREPDFIEGWEAAEAACGGGVRTVLAIPFNTSDGDACPRCVEQAKRWTQDPGAYIAWIDERYEERQERDQLSESLREYHQRQERELG